MVDKMTEEKTTETPQKEAVNPIAELFWPKEMKELVKKYRAEGTCNEEAVRYVNKAIWKHISIFLIIAFMLLTTSEVMAAGILFLLTPLFVWFDIRNLFRKQMAAYVCGRRALATVKNVGISLYGTQKIKYKLEPNEKTVLSFIFIGSKPRLDKKDIPQKGAEFSIYYDPDNQYRAMPDIDYLKEKYSLTTTIL